MEFFKSIILGLSIYFSILLIISIIENTVHLIKTGKDKEGLFLILIIILISITWTLYFRL